MKKNIPFGLLLSYFVLIAGSTYGQSALNVKVKTIDNEYTSLKELKGSALTVIDFWATYCKPCVKSIPKLVALSKEYDKAEVAFVGINADSPRNISKVRPFAKSLQIDYPVILDTNQELYGELQVVSLPTLIILNKDGKVVFIHEGYVSGDEKLFKSKIEELLDDEN